MSEGFIISNLEQYPSIEEIDWSSGAYVTPCVKQKYTSGIPWNTVIGYEKYECRYFPYSTLTVRNRETKVECIHRYYDMYAPLKGKYVTLWVDGERVKVNVNNFEQYRRGNK